MISMVDYQFKYINRNFLAQCETKLCEWSQARKNSGCFKNCDFRSASDKSWGGGLGPRLLEAKLNRLGLPGGFSAGPH